MNKLKMHSPDVCQEHIAKIYRLFPNCVTEAQDKKTGQLRLKVDFDRLRQELGDAIVEGPQERYRLDWPGKQEALAVANGAFAMTLRPVQKKSVDFHSTKNLFIEGDNLDALKMLQETYLGKIKMVYIDPPYNTGKDFIYKDNYAESSTEYLKKTKQVGNAGEKLISNTESNGRFHSDWLSMIYPRLRVARNLLAEDGVIVVHIDENEYSNLEKVLTEIYGENNNLGTIVWDKRNPKGDATRIAQQHEYIVVFCKDYVSFKEKVDFRCLKEHAQIILNKADSLIQSCGGVNQKSRKQFKDWLSKQEFSQGEKAYSQIDDEGNVFQTVSMAWPNNRTKAPKEYYIPLKHPKTGKNCPVPKKGWRNPPNTMKGLLENGEIVFGPDETTQPRRKYMLKDNTKENVSSLLYHGGSDESLLSELKVQFDNPKPIHVAKYLIQTICSKEDIILDFFGGSATTAHAVLDLNANDGGNRKYILVQLPEKINKSKTICDIAIKRIRNASKLILQGECHSGWNQDVGFRYLRVEESNMKDIHYYPDDIKQKDILDSIDNVKSNRTDLDVLFQVLVDWGIDLTLPIRSETLNGKTVIFVDNNILVACFDKDVSEDFMIELTRHKPMRIVFRDINFVSDAAKMNLEQIFLQYSPDTEVKSI